MLLKYLIFIVVITLFESCNDSKVQGNWFGLVHKPHEYFHEGKSAENDFIAEENRKSKKIDDLEEDKQKNAGKLNPKKTATVLFSRENLKKPWKIPWLFMKKCVQVIRNMKNIVKRDWIINPKLKAAKKKRKEEALFDNKLKGPEICAKAFEHKFFTHVKKWKLVANHPNTIAREKLWIRVQTPHFEIKAEYDAKEKIKEEKRSNSEKNYELGEKKIPEVKRKKFWRPAKLCMAKKMELADKDDPNEPFEVYISSAKGYGMGHTKWHPNTFVFLTTPRNLRDWLNYLVFWWHRVVYVEGYVW